MIYHIKKKRKSLRIDLNGISEDLNNNNYDSTLYYNRNSDIHTILACYSGLTICILEGLA